MIIKRTLLKACNSIRFLPRKRTTRILLMENHMRHSNDMMLSACYVNICIDSDCKDVVWLFFSFLSYTLLCDPNLNRCDTKVFQFFSVLQTNVITFRANTIWILHFHRYGMCFFLHFIAEEAVEDVTFPLKIPSQNEQHFSINFMRFSTVCLQFYNFFFFSIEITR